MADNSLDNAKNRLAKTGRLGLIGYLGILLFFGGFGYWAVTAQLSGAAIAQGRIAAAGENQTVQHLEGGIINAIHIREGDRVRAGDPIFTLSDVQIRSTLYRLERQKVSLEARLTRLQAERDQQSTFEFLPELIAQAGELGLSEFLDEQRKQFDARLNRQQAEDEILNQRITALNDALVGFNAQKKALQEQIDVVAEEVQRKLELLEKGLTNRSEYTELLRAEADLVGRLGTITSEIARANTQIVEAREQIQRQESAAIEAAIQEINQIRVELADINERINSSNDVLTRLIVRAPTDGLVIAMAKNTTGSVVRSGEDLATILPTDNELVVTARLNLADIDNVRPGQPAQLRMSALNLRRTPEVPGEVIFVSPDRLIDEATQTPYYEARLRITSLPDEVNEEQIYPGMPVEALIATEQRTFADYIIRPILDSMSLAFREE